MIEALRTLLAPPPQVREALVDVPLFPFGVHGSPAEHQGLGLPAFWRGVRIRADLISTLALNATVDGQVLDVAPPLLVQPDPSEDRSTTLAKVEASLILHGEAVVLLGGHDEWGFPTVAKVIHPHDAQLSPAPRPGEAWSPSWTIGGRTYGSDEVLHIVAFALPGEVRGVGAIELHRRVVEGEITAAEVNRSFSENGAMPSIVISVPFDWSPTESAEFKSVWMAKMRGRREPIAIPDNVSAAPFSISQADAQYVESRQLGIIDIANVVGLPADFLGWQGSSRTYTNSQDERRRLLDFYLRGSVYKIERAFSSVLPITAKFDLDTFLRLDPKGTAEVMAIEGRFMMIDELRAIKNLPPLPDGRGQMLGAEVFTQQAGGEGPSAAKGDDS